MQKAKNKSNKGFTLVELIVVIGIIGILSVVAIVAFGGIQDSAQRAVIQATANQVVSQLNLFNGLASDDNRITYDQTPLTQDELTNGVLLIIHPSGIDPADHNPSNLAYRSTYGNILFELGLEPFGNPTLASQVLRVIEWNDGLGRWRVDPAALASEPQ